MSDIVKYLRDYLTDPASVMTKWKVEDAITEIETLRELLWECRTGWYLNDELNARIDAALKQRKQR